MRKIILFTILLFCLTGVSAAQKLHWTYVQIPEDSVYPCSLTFYDSLHGYLRAFQTTYPLGKSIYFETVDGGKNWKKIVDSLVGYTNISGGGGGEMFNSPVVYASLSSRYMYTPYLDGTGGPNGAIIHTTNSGTNWQIPFPNSGKFYYPLRAFDPYNLVVCDFDSGVIYQTVNAGRSYSRLADTAYINTLYHLQLDPNYQGYGQFSSYWGKALSFDNSDRFHWTVALDRQNEDYTNPRLHPLGLQTLVTDNFGRTWKPYLTNIPGQDSLGRLAGTLQYIKGTPNLYYFTGGKGEGTRGTGLHLSIADYGDAMLGISWMYSTDYGKSWEIFRQYGDRRRAFEAVKQNEVWISARPENSKNSTDAATVIARTTDNGMTWAEDKQTLTNDGTWDARILTFSDPNHGWIAATDNQGLYGNHIFIFRYDGSEQNTSSVEGLSTETNQAFLKIYPNPSSYMIHLLLPTSKPITKVEFYDLMGRQDYPPYQLQGNLANVDVKNLPPGTYIARVSYLYKGYNGVFTLPLIVRH